MYKRNKNSGFTLIELMVVIAIMGILMAIAVPYYSQYLKDSKATAAPNTLLQLQALENQFYADYHVYAGGYTLNGAAPTSQGATNGKLAWNSNTLHYFSVTIRMNNTAQNETITAKGLAAAGMQKWTYAVNSNGVECMVTNGTSLTLAPWSSVCPSGSTTWTQ
jgi:prepilin-type N-terminal cleavage/methylation domain-containing protein